MNTTLTSIKINCEAPFLLVCFCFLEKLSCFSLLVNRIGDAGVSDIAEALKVNNTLIEIHFWSE